MNILFFHGLAGSPDDIDRTAAHMPGWRFLAPQIPYLDPSFQTIEQIAEHVRQKIPESFLPENTVVAGNSLGGALALSLGASFSRIMLVASHLRTSTRRIGRGVLAFQHEISQIFHDPQRIPHDRKKRYEAMWNEFTSCRKKFRLFRNVKTMSERFDFNTRYCRLQDRIIIVCGRSDRISPVESFQSLVQQYPGMRMHVVEQCGHAIPLERPDALAGLFQQWAFGRGGRVE
ncbi:MAG: alpha/beta fold hydrolase [Desulfovibrionales bacterium]